MSNPVNAHGSLLAYVAAAVGTNSSLEDGVTLPFSTNAICRNA